MNILFETNTPKIEGEIADYILNRDGILISYSKPVKRTVQNITENVALVKKITENKKFPLLIYLCNSPIPDKATRIFSAQQIHAVDTAMAMIYKPGLANLIMKMAFTLQPPPVPIRFFPNEAEAWNWYCHLQRMLTNKKFYFSLRPSQLCVPHFLP
jgi:hypothetical protein